MSNKQSENESNYLGFSIKDISGAEVKKDNVRREVPPNSLASLITSFSGTNANVYSEKSEHQNSNTHSPTTSIDSLRLPSIVTVPSNSRNILGLISTNECLSSSTHNPNITYRERSQSIFKPIDGLQLTSALVASQQTRRPKTSEDQLVAIEESLANFRNATSLPPLEESQTVAKDTTSSSKDKYLQNYKYNYSKSSLKTPTNSPHIYSTDKLLARSRNSLGLPSTKELRQNPIQITQNMSAKESATDSSCNLVKPSTKGLLTISANIQAQSSCVQPPQSLGSPTTNETEKNIQPQPNSGPSLDPQSNTSFKVTTTHRSMEKITDLVSSTSTPTEKSKRLKTIEDVIAKKLTEGFSSDLKSNISPKATTTRRVMEKLADMISSTPIPTEKSRRLQNMEAVIAKELTDRLSSGNNDSEETQNIIVTAEKLAKWADDLVNQRISNTRVDRHDSLVEEEQESPVSARPSSVCSTFLFSESPTVCNEYSSINNESSDIVVTIQQLGEDACIRKVENSDNKDPKSLLHIQQTDGSIVEVETVEDNHNKKVALVRKLKGESSNPESKDWSTWMVEVAMPTLDWTPSVKEDKAKAKDVDQAEKMRSIEVRTNTETGEEKLMLDTVTEGSPSNQMIKEAQTFFEISNKDKEGTKGNEDSWTNMVLEVASLMVEKMSLNNATEPQTTENIARESLKKLPILQRQCMSSSEEVNVEKCSVQKTRRMPLLERQCSKINNQKEEDDVAHIKLGRNPVETITNIILPSPPSHNPFNDPLDNLEKYHRV